MLFLDKSDSHTVCGGIVLFLNILQLITWEWHTYMNTMYIVHFPPSFVFQTPPRCISHLYVECMCVWCSYYPMVYVCGTYIFMGLGISTGAQLIIRARSQGGKKKKKKTISSEHTRMWYVIKCYICFHFLNG